MKNEQTTTETVITKELLDFADYFGKNFKILTSSSPIPTIYKSEHGNYTIKYFDDIIDSVTGDKAQNQSGRISHDTGIIELSRNYFKKDIISSDFIFFIIICLKTLPKTGSIFNSDAIALANYIKQKRSVESLIKGLYEVDGDLKITKYRIKSIMELNDSYNKNLGVKN